MKGNAPMKPIVCTLLLVFMTGRAPAWAEGNGALSVEGPELQRAQKQLEDGDFDRAVETLERGLSRPDLTDAQLVEMYRLLGLASLYLGREEKAREAYEKLLQAMPDYELPRVTSPKVRLLYARIKTDIKKRRVRPVTLTFEPLQETAGDHPVVLKVRIDDLALGSKPKLFFRRAGNQSFSSVDFGKDRAEGALFRAILPGYELESDRAGYDVEYYVEVTDAAQRRLAGRGDVDQPLRFHVHGKQESPPGTTGATLWYKSPWIYVGAGVVLAGATTGVIVLANQKPSTSLTLTIHVEPSP